jgi:hypothetical protein
VRKPTVAGIGILLALVSALQGQEIPSPTDVVGHELGERFTSTAEVLSYTTALAAASPRVRLETYGQTPEGRPLIVLIIAREDRWDEMDDIVGNNRRLLDRGLSDDEVQAIARRNPAIAWLGYGVHGSESSSTEAALWTAYDLATDAPEARGLLDSLVVVMDPMINPDGRDRYVNWYRSVRGEAPNPTPGTLEHRPPWPGGRYNHYLFDLNRDWAWSTQPETRARLSVWLYWRPQVSVDFHEMSPFSTYFFFPATPPINPIYPDYTLRWARYFGDSIAAAFDAQRWLYFTRETFDLFYPGYGDSWPSLWGAIGMTFEQAGGGGAGLSIRRPDGSLLTLADRAARHRVSGLATLRAAANRKTDFVREFAGFHRAPPPAGGHTLIVPGRTQAAGTLAALLQRQGLRVERAASAVDLSADPHPGYRARSRFPEGTLLVRGDQPGWRLARTLLQPEVAWDSTSRQFSYDLTAWSLPYAYGLEAHTVSTVPGGAFVPLGPVEDVPARGAADSGYGYLVAPTFEAAGPIHRYVSSGGRARAISEEFRVGGTRWPRGTYFLPAGDSTAAWIERAGLAGLVEPVSSGRTREGVDLGTGRALNLSAPKIAVLAGEGIQASGFGAAWYVLEKLAGIEFDALPAQGLAGRQLRDYGVVVVPPARRLPEAERNALQAWVRAGGTLVALGSSSGWVGSDLGEIEARAGEDEAAGEEEELQRALRSREERRLDRWEEGVHGIVVPTAVDGDHPLVWGVDLLNDDGRLFVLHRADLSFEPAESFETVVHFPERLEAAAGVVSDAKLEELASSGWLVSGRLGAGTLILFADDPLFRAFWRSNFLLFTNALLLGPAM